MNTRRLNFTKLTRREVLVAAATTTAMFACGRAGAQASYPNRPIRLVHAFAAGSGTDNTGRILAERLSQRLGQPVVVENKPGANMILGSEFAARQPPDGHTLIMVTLDNLGINPFLYRNPGYSIRDFDLLTLIGTLPLVLVAASSFPYNTLQELRAAAAASRQPFSFGTWGVGSVAHMYGELIQSEAGIPFNFVPFQGAAPATTATLGGHVDLTLATAFTSFTNVKAGRAKGLAIGGSARNPDLPEVRTFAEQGYPNVGGVQWHGIAVRAGGNREIVDKLYGALKEVLNEPETKEKILKTGYTAIDGRSPAAFESFVAQEARKWERIVKTSGVTAER